MHYHLEVIMPPTNNVKQKLEEILAKYYEEYEDEEGGKNKYAFYDFYSIGGRWSGVKLEAILGAEKIKKFRELLTEKNITVSGIIFGKETLKPESQIPVVDAMWCEFFPESPVKQCPLFDHYKESYGDILMLSELPEELEASHVIIAGPSWDNDETLEAKYMVQESIYNGVDWLDVVWDKKINTAIAEYTKSLDCAAKDYQKKQIPQKDWLCVTVDYHS